MDTDDVEEKLEGGWAIRDRRPASPPRLRSDNFPGPRPPPAPRPPTRNGNLPGATDLGPRPRHGPAPHSARPRPWRQDEAMRDRRNGCEGHARNCFTAAQVEPRRSRTQDHQRARRCRQHLNSRRRRRLRPARVLQSKGGDTGPPVAILDRTAQPRLRYWTAGCDTGPHGATQVAILDRRLRYCPPRRNPSCDTGPPVAILRRS